MTSNRQYLLGTNTTARQQTWTSVCAQTPTPEHRHTKTSTQNNRTTETEEHKTKTVEFRVMWLVDALLETGSLHECCLKRLPLTGALTAPSVVSSQCVTRHGVMLIASSARVKRVYTLEKITRSKSFPQYHPTCVGDSLATSTTYLLLRVGTVSHASSKYFLSFDTRRPTSSKGSWPRHAAIVKVCSSSVRAPYAGMQCCSDLHYLLGSGQRPTLSQCGPLQHDSCTRQHFTTAAEEDSKPSKKKNACPKLHNVAIFAWRAKCGAASGRSASFVSFVLIRCSLLRCFEEFRCQVGAAALLSPSSSRLRRESGLGRSCTSSTGLGCDVNTIKPCFLDANQIGHSSNPI